MSSLHVTRPSATRPLSTRQTARAVDVLAASFHDEPNFVDLLPRTAGRERALAAIFAGLLRDAVRHGRVDVAVEADEILGVAVWFGPGAYPPSTARQLRMLPELARTVRAAPASTRRLATFNRRLAARHPSGPYAYLVAVGADPAHQGRGVGRRLLQAGLGWVDDLDVAAYLEAQRHDTVAWYRRHGFAVQYEQSIIPGGATNWGMLRETRSA